jgi:hypothetical protein
MLKKSLFSPAQPRRAETCLFPYGVLASLRGSTYRSVRLASSLAAALLDSPFEHTADYSGTITLRIIVTAWRTKTEFFCRLLEGWFIQRLLAYAICHFPFEIGLNKSV